MRSCRAIQCHRPGAISCISRAYLRRAMGELEVLERAIEAHGGRALWEGAGEVCVRVSSGGLAFSSKLQGSAVRGVEARIATTGQHVTFDPYPRAGTRGVLERGGSGRP